MINYVSVEGIAKSFGERVLFENISFGINQGQKIGFVAKNGSGKTSMLKLIVQDELPDTGQVVYRKGIRKAFLPQEPNLDPNLSIQQTIFASDHPVLKVIEAYQLALQNPQDIEAYQKAYEAMDVHSAWDFETQYQQLLTKLQLGNLDQKVSTLSGGQRKRLALANILLSQPDLIFLDEPTNHLDLEMIEWLENFLKKGKYTLFMITHDRYFLENVCNDIIELDQGKLYSYKGNYDYYLAHKQERLANEQSELHKAKSLFKKELEWMRRQPKARTTKSKSRIDDFHQIKQKAHQRREDHQVQLEINMKRLGGKIVEFHKVSKQFEDLKVLDKFEYVFKKGERVGIIGKNGMGKSSFLNLLTGVILPDQGKIVVGETVQFGYYTQKGIEVKSGQKVIDVIREFGDYIPLNKGRQLSASQLLERFLFDRKKQYDFVDKLSGGERKRLYLCTVLIQNPNFLILDEPTNDLDIVTLNVLESFLLDYPGCLVVVSHDRYFMDKVVDHLFVFSGAGQISDFPGNYTDFRVYEGGITTLDKHVKPTKEEKIPVLDIEKESSVGSKSDIKLSYEDQKQLNRLETAIKRLEKTKQELEKSFLNTNLDAIQIQEVSQEIKQITLKIEYKELEWLELCEKLNV